MLTCNVSPPPSPPDDVSRCRKHVRRRETNSQENQRTRAPVKGRAEKLAQPEQRPGPNTGAAQKSRFGSSPFEASVGCSNAARRGTPGQEKQGQEESNTSCDGKGPLSCDNRLRREATCSAPSPCKRTLPVRHRLLIRCVSVQESGDTKHRADLAEQRVRDQPAQGGLTCCRDVEFTLVCSPQRGTRKDQEGARGRPHHGEAGGGSRVVHVRKTGAARKFLLQVRAKVETHASECV